MTAVAGGEEGSTEVTGRAGSAAVAGKPHAITKMGAAKHPANRFGHEISDFGPPPSAINRC